MPQLSAEARDLTWLIGNFEKQTPGVAHAMVVSADGLPVAVSDRLDRPMADQLAAIASGLASLTQGAASLLDCGLLKQTVVEMDRGLLIVMSIRDGSCLAVLAASPLRRGRGRLPDGRARHPRRRGPHPHAPGRTASRPPSMSAQHPTVGGRSGIGIAVEHTAPAGNPQQTHRHCCTHSPGQASP
jgi:predicted regulator of Ras-like GTPase activity (Roadblock/LC7/MglB family)